MDFITIKQEEPMQWSAKADLEIYAILAIPLITVTMLIYALVEMVQRAKESNQEEDVCKIVQPMGLGSITKLHSIYPNRATLSPLLAETVPGLFLDQYEI